MKNKASDALLVSFERAARTPRAGRYVLRLYVTGMTTRGTRAIENVRAICDEHLDGRYELQIVDLYRQPALARDEQIIAVPTLVKQEPPPRRRVIGDMSHPDRVLAGLDLDPRPQAHT